MLGNRLFRPMRRRTLELLRGFIILILLRGFIILIVAQASAAFEAAACAAGKRMRSRESSSVWVVCPAFNEAPAIGRVLSDLSRTDYDVVVVDDCSCDATRHIATELDATVISHPINLGQGAALKTGIEYALAQGATYIVTFDADGQHRVGDIPRLLDALDHARADF